jgi:hypothetical protein
MNMHGNAQSAMGKLAGKVTDESTNESLSGVSIVIKGTKSGGSSITDGTYILSLPAGTYTIVYSSTGYSAKEITGVEIKSGETSLLNIILSPNRGSLSEVKIVTAKRETQAAIYNVQKRSAAASDGISIETILKTPDNNAGQITKRITGVSVQGNRFVVVRGLADQYNQTILNGVPMTSTETDRNSFALDLIPAAVIDNIVVNKTATPDMPGNFAGGLVQINTKEFPTSNFVSISLQGSFYDQTIGKDFYNDKRSSLEWLGFGGKVRDLPGGFPMPLSKTPLTLLNAQEKTRYISMLKNNLAPIDYGPSLPNYNVQLGLGKTIRFKAGSQFGIVFALNQRKTELLEQEISAMRPRGPGAGGTGDFQYINYYSENIRYNYESSLGGALNIAYRFGNNKISLKNLYSNILRNVYIDRPYASIESFDVILSPNSYVAGTTHFIEERRIISSILSGEHRTGANNETRLDWNINIANYKFSNPDSRNFLYRKDSTEILQGNTNLGLSQALSSQSRIWNDNNDFIYGGAFNAATVFNLFRQKQLLKGGILFQNRSRKATGVLVPYVAPVGKLENFLDPVNVYPGGPLDYAISFAYVAGQVGNYNAGSSLLAAYESLENNLGKKIRLIWGLRVENYHQFVNVYNPVFYNNNFNEPDLVPALYASRNNFDFFPSVNLIYALSNKINIRGGFSNTVVRPELRDLTPFISYDFKTLQVTQGNADLKSTSIRNYDLKFEFFPSAGEILSFAAYYKNIQDPIERVAGTDNDFAVRPLNTGSAYVKGLEIEARKKLDFISVVPWLENVSLFGNASLIDSKVKAGSVNSLSVSRVTEHTLSGQPDYLVNAGISILAFRKSFELTLSYNNSSDYIIQLGTFDEATLTNGNKTPTSPDYRIKGRPLLDLVLTQSFLNDRARIKFNISNILKEPFIIYQDLNGNKKFDQTVTVDKTGMSGNHTITGGIDNTPSSVLGQRNYSLTFSYTFSR